MLGVGGITWFLHLEIRLEQSKAKTKAKKTYMYIILDMERTEGHMVMNCSRSEPSSPAWGGELSSQRAAGRFLPEEWLTYLDFCQLPLVVLGHRKYRVLHDGLHLQGEVLHNVAAADGTEMNPEERINMIR